MHIIVLSLFLLFLVHLRLFHISRCVCCCCCCCCCGYHFQLSLTFHCTVQINPSKQTTRWRLFDNLKTGPLMVDTICGTIFICTYYPLVMTYNHFIWSAIWCVVMQCTVMYCTAIRVWMRWDEMRWDEISGHNISVVTLLRDWYTCLCDMSFYCHGIYIRCCWVSFLLSGKGYRCGSFVVDDTTTV